MGFYVGDYTTDVGQVLKNVALEAWSVTNDLKSPTDPTEDAPYIPSVLANHVIDADLGCQLTLTARHAQVWISPVTYWVVPCPFPGGTPEHLEFFVDLATNPDVLFSNLRGESVNAWHTELWATGAVRWL